MIHDKRRYRVKDYTDLDLLAQDLTERTWTLCSGFRYNGVTFLNDSFSEDGAGEYAAIIEKDGHTLQVESITFSWCTPEQAKQNILACVKYAEGTDKPPMNEPHNIRQHNAGSCPLCA